MRHLLCRLLGFKWHITFEWEQRSGRMVVRCSRCGKPRLV